MRETGEERTKRILTHPMTEVLIDSGAFTALNAGREINLDEYMEWLDKWKRHLHGYLALDVIGNLQESPQQSLSLSLYLVIREASLALSEILHLRLEPQGPVTPEPHLFSLIYRDVHPLCVGWLVVDARSSG